MAVCLCVSLHAGSRAPIPQTVWDMKEDPAQGIKGAVVLERRMTLTGMAIQHRVRVRVLSEAGRLSELASSDALDLDHPFEVTFVLEHPNGATPRGTSLVLVGWGLPPAPGIIQKPGIPRRLPVAARESMVRSLRATWTFPHPVRPALPERRSDSPFRTVAWRVLAEDRSVRVELDDEQKEARFDGDARAGAVAAWKKDRSLFQTLADQGLTFIR